MAGNNVNNRGSSTGNNRNRSVQRNTKDNYRIPDVLEYKSVKKVKKANNKKRKKKNNTISVLVALLGGSTVIALFLCLILLMQHFTKTGAAGSETLPIQTSPFEVNTAPHYVSINMESCTVLVGQSFTVTISAYPTELMASVIWTSNNENVAYVDENGYVTIVGEGIAAITATSGECSDAIALEAVADENTQTSLGLPMYSKVESVTTPGSLLPVTPSQGESSTSAVEESQPYETENDANNIGANPQPPENIPPDVTSGQENTLPVQQPAEMPPEASGSPSYGAEENVRPTLPTQEATTAAAEIDTAEMFALLTNGGFTQYLSTACIYEENGNYMGEVIVESDSVHIYIKNRSTQFDTAIKMALAYLLPKSSDTVWSTYISATTDTTISVDGRKVRVVLPAQNAHSQIIVYNK